MVPHRLVVVAVHPELVGTHQVAQQALLGDPDRDVAERVRARAVVLVADPPDRLSAKGASHRSSDDQASRQIGDEIAVARALRHLADQLIVEAERDIEERTGEEAHVRTT